MRSHRTLQAMRVLTWIASLAPFPQIPPRPLRHRPSRQHRHRSCPRYSRFRTLDSRRRRGRHTATHFRRRIHRSSIDSWSHPTPPPALHAQSHLPPQLTVASAHLLHPLRTRTHPTRSSLVFISCDPVVHLAGPHPVAGGRLRITREPTRAAAHHAQGWSGRGESAGWVGYGDDEDGEREEVDGRGRRFEELDRRRWGWRGDGDGEKLFGWELEGRGKDGGCALEGLERVHAGQEGSSFRIRSFGRCFSVSFLAFALHFSPHFCSGNVYARIHSSLHITGI